MNIEIEEADSDRDRVPIEISSDSRYHEGIPISDVGSRFGDRSYRCTPFGRREFRFPISRRHFNFRCRVAIRRSLLPVHAFW